MSKRADFPCPQVMRAFDSYRSPVSDELIESRSGKEKDLAKHDCMPAQDVKPRIRKESSDAG